MVEVLMRRLAARKSAPKFTKESTLRHYALAAGVPVSRKSIRNLVLFLSGIGVADFFQDPEKRQSQLNWKVPPIALAQQSLGLAWKPSNAEIHAFMESL